MRWRTFGVRRQSCQHSLLEKEDKDIGESCDKRSGKSCDKRSGTSCDKEKGTSCDKGEASDESCNKRRKYDKFLRQRQQRWETYVKSHGDEVMRELVTATK